MPIDKRTGEFNPFEETQDKIPDKPLEAHGVREYALQPNAISQSIHSLSPYAKKLTAMAMSLIPDDGANPLYVYRIEFSIRNFMDSLGISDGTEQRERIISALRECASSILEINSPAGWITIPWFSYLFWRSKIKEKADDTDTTNFYHNDKLLDGLFRSKFHSPLPEFAHDETLLTLGDTVEIAFNPILTSAIRHYKKAYAKLNLINFGKLQSTYAIRFYELAMSYNGFAGKEGNPKGAWYFEKSLKELRMLFKIEKNKYKLTSDFRKFVIESSIKELNEAKIGIKITIEYIRDGKYLVGARFNCKFTDDKLQKSAKKSIQSTEMEEKPTKISPEEFAEMKEKYPAEWEKIREEVSQNYYGGWKSAGVTEKSKSGEAIVDEMTFIRLKEELGL